MRAERAALSELLEQVGPAAPTLCAGWLTHDLAAHLTLREARPDMALGMIPALAGHARRLFAAYRRRPYLELVNSFRAGPPRLSVFSLPGVDSLANLLEFYVHHEDVRRARPGFVRRELTQEMQERLWRGVRRVSKLLFRSAPTGVLLRRPDGVTAPVRAGDPVVTISGVPSEIALFAFGRERQALVELSGEQQAVRALLATPRHV